MAKASGRRMVSWDWLWITAVALAVQAFWAARMTHPTYFDAYYYTTNAQRLAEGYGFTEEVIWQYLDDPAGLPAPSFTYWMPLTSIIAAAGYALGDSFRAMQAPFWLLAGLLPLLAYAISWNLSGGVRWQARTAALLTAAGGYYTAYWVQPSTFVLFAWVGGGCLLALAYGLARGTAVPWLIAGLLAGLSHLTRADGILLLAVGGWVWLLGANDSRLKIKAGEAETNFQSLIFNLFIFVFGYLLVMGGWFWRTWQVTGRPLSTVGTQTIFLTTYDDVFAYGRHFGLIGYLDWGWANILESKAQALSLAVQTFIAVTGLTVFTFFFVWSWIKLGRQREKRDFIRPFTWYTIIVFGAMSLIFTFPGQRGSLLHTSTALWSWSMALAAAGIGIAVDWTAARLPHWQPERSKPLFAAMFLVVAYAVSFVVSVRQPLLQEEAAVFQEIGAVLPADAVVMVGNAPGFYYHTGLPSLAVPNEPPAVTLAAARRYGADFLILDQDRPPPLSALYEGEISAPGVTLMHEFHDGRKLYRLTEGAE